MFCNMTWFMPSRIWERRSGGRIKTCTRRGFPLPSLTRTGIFFRFLVCHTDTQLTLPLHQERIQVVRSGVVRRIPAQRHARNGPWTHERCFEVLYVHELVCVYICCGPFRTLVTVHLWQSHCIRGLQYPKQESGLYLVFGLLYQLTARTSIIVGTHTSGVQ